MNQNPEQLVRDEIDKMLHASGWLVQSKTKINLSADVGIAVREYQTNIGPADDVLFVNKTPVDIIEAKGAEEGVHLTLRFAQQQLKTYRQAVLKWAFEGKLTAEWRQENWTKVRLPAVPQEIHVASSEIEPELIAAEPIADYQQKENNDLGENELPKGWKFVPLKDLAILITDGDHPSPPKSKEGVLFITISNVNKANNKLDFTDTFLVTKEYYFNLKENRKPQKGDVLYTVTGSFGIPVLINFEKNFCFQRHIGLIRPLKTVNQKWLYYLLRSPEVYNQAKQTATGIAQKTVALSSLRNFEFPICPIEEQHNVVQEIESRLSIADKMQETITQSLQQAEALRQSILKKAFEGKLAVVNADIKADAINSQDLLTKKSVAPVVKLHQEDFPQKIAGITEIELHAGVIAMIIKAHEISLKYSSKLSYAKCEKISDQVERNLGISLGRAAKKDAAGPDDFPHLKKVEHRANKAGYFEAFALPIGHTYKPLRGMGKILEKVKAVLNKSDFEALDNLIQTFLPFELEHAELVATLYADWNNLLIAGKNPTSEEIVYESREIG